MSGMHIHGCLKLKHEFAVRAMTSGVEPSSMEICQHFHIFSLLCECLRSHCSLRWAWWTLINFYRCSVVIRLFCIVNGPRASLTLTLPTIASQRQLQSENGWFCLCPGCAKAAILRIGISCTVHGVCDWADTAYELYGLADIPIERSCLFIVASQMPIRVHSLVCVG